MVVALKAATNCTQINNVTAETTYCTESFFFFFKIMIMTHQSKEKSLEVAQSNFLNYIKMLDGSKKPLPEHLFHQVLHENVTGMVDGH